MPSLTTQDLSAVSPELADAWIKEFENQAAQEHFWEERTLPQFRLKIHGIIAIAAQGLPDVLAALLANCSRHVGCQATIAPIGASPLACYQRGHTRFLEAFEPSEPLALGGSADASSSRLRLGLRQIRHCGSP